MNTISPYLITKLYTWTVNDLNLIFDKCFAYNHLEERLDGPSSTYAITLAALVETWGSIIRDAFGDPTHESYAATINTVCVLKELYERDPHNYEIVDASTNEVMEGVAELFRHNLVHNFGKKPKGEEFDLNVDCEGLTINQQDNGRWHINCMKLKEDFLNLLRIKLPDLLST